jgi:hypothetical protein
MKNTSNLFAVCPVSGVLTIRAQKLRILDAQTRVSASKTPVWLQSLMIVLLHPSVRGAIGFSTKLARMLFGKMATRYWSHSRSTQSQAIIMPVIKLSRRHFGLARR